MPFISDKLCMAFWSWSPSPAGQGEKMISHTPSDNHIDEENKI